ncbi:hypothetical protein SDC9_110330 [bioreactor metagenome]|uniref:Uncharacterized protein n=1 Tax=bioreactor metagenome TaxID=1076179 RepID=A0A645BDA8_9ZZZZ
MVQDDLAGKKGVCHADALDLRDHDVAGVAGGKAAGLPGHFRRVGRRGYNGGLFHHHGNDVLLAVDEEVHGHAHGQLIGSDDVFNHMICRFQTQCAGIGQAVKLFLRQAGKLCRLRGSLLNRQLMESGILICLHWKRSFQKSCFVPPVFTSPCLPSSA